MSTTPGDPKRPSDGQQAISRRAWPRERQLLVAGIGFAGVVALVLGVWLGDAVLGKRAAPAAAPTLPPGTFRASPGQMKTLTVESVGLHAFVSEELTEGKIAANGDRETPIFSPYSGLITRVI